MDLADRDIVFATLSASPVFVDVLTRTEGGLLAGRTAPSLVVDASTVSLEASATVRRAGAARGTALLAAPVSGNAKVASAGRLAVVVSGPRAAYDLAASYLAQLAQSVTYVGEGDRARLVRICHDLVLGVVTQVLAETSVLAEETGISRADYRTFLNDSVMGSVFSRYKTPVLVNLDLTPTFTGTCSARTSSSGSTRLASTGSPCPLLRSSTSSC